MYGAVLSYYGGDYVPPFATLLEEEQEKMAVTLGNEAGG